MALAERNVVDVDALISYMLGSPRPTPIWFRGQGCHHRGLQTSLSRRLTSTEPAHVQRIEKRLITRFRQRSLALWPEGYPQTDWEHLFAMQHFGVPTRLLDWTEGLLMGIYFAADHDATRCGCEEGDCKATIWVLDPVKLNEYNSRLEGMNVGVLTTTDEAANPWAPGANENVFAPWPAAIYGTHNNARIVAQQGTFTVAGKEPVPLEEASAVVHHDGVLEKILIDENHHSIRERLRLLGVRRATVYPDLPGLALDIATEEHF